jgi:hypothetical protein
MQISSNLSLDFRPYGQFFESDKYIEFSLGNIFLIAFHKDIPPIPESKKPIGEELI